ncbi:MAG: hypothetical protein GOVbin2006_6 [Prokaryotic dsDNA virus sp.]|nr:MAG: hypothetical protein GOVbin2006_6 [Prokaryotic dsDNA virus sp.]|tara:strand:- start:301 stop:984 length:684 start_codon:yes stop_codon:yes gene_type:complete
MPLAQRMSLCLPTIRPLGGWSPRSEDTALAWWEKNTGITKEGSVLLQWNDQINGDHNFSQADEEKTPTIDSNGVVTFTGGQHLEIGTQITFAESSQFTFGMRVDVSELGSLFADNTSTGEFLRLTSETNLRVRIGNATSHNFALPSGTWSDKKTIIVTRDADMTVKVFHDGTQISNTVTDEGQFLIDVFGVRRIDTNPYEGTLHEAAIFTSTSDQLVSDLNNYLIKI